ETQPTKYSLRSARNARQRKSETTPSAETRDSATRRRDAGCVRRVGGGDTRGRRARRPGRKPMYPSTRLGLRLRLDRVIAAAGQHGDRIVAVIGALSLATYLAAAIAFPKQSGQIVVG